jgi:hypothetical protein
MEAHAHSHVEHRKTGHTVIDVVVSVCALLISAVSILMAYHTGHNMERLVHANSWPALHLGSGNGSGDALVLSFSLHNAGIGPAQIYTLEFTCGDFAMSWRESLTPLLEACCAEAVRSVRATNPRWTPEISSLPVAGSFLSPREGVNAFQWPRREAEAKAWNALDRARIQGRVAMRACYCSVFDECWVAETGKFPPRHVPSCPPTQPR